MSYADSLKAQLNNKNAGVGGGASNPFAPEMAKLRRVVQWLDTRGEGGTGNPSRHDHFSDDYHPKTGTKCWYCDRFFYMDRTIIGRRLLERTKDHIVPLSKGGNNTLINMIACCQECNAAKGNKTLKNFATLLRHTEYHSHMGKLKRLMAVRAMKLHNKRNGIISKKPN